VGAHPRHRRAAQGAALAPVQYYPTPIFQYCTVALLYSAANGAYITRNGDIGPCGGSDPRTGAPPQVLLLLQGFSAPVRVGLGRLSADGLKAVLWVKGGATGVPGEGGGEGREPGRGKREGEGEGTERERERGREGEGREQGGRARGSAVSVRGGLVCSGCGSSGPRGRDEGQPFPWPRSSERRALPMACWVPREGGKGEGKEGKGRGGVFRA